MTRLEPPPPIEELTRDPPAVANLLLHGGAPNGDALAATVLDLAARGVIEIEELSPTEHMCHVPHGANPVGLEPFEVRVLDLLRERAVGGSVPAGALTIGIHDETSEWWSAFAANVTAEARARGYVSDWLRVVATLSIGMLIVTVVALMSGAIDRHSGALRVAAGLAFAGCCCLAVLWSDKHARGVFSARMLWFGPSRLQRLSRRGHDQSHWWQHARHLLGADQGFSEVRAAGVLVWNRYLAYAAALGLAPTAARDVPVGPDGAGSTWVVRGEMWHRVDVRYPRRIPPGWGHSPTRAGFVGALWVAACGTLVVLASRSGVWFPHPPFATGVAHVIGDLEPVIAGAALVGLAFGSWELAMAVGDLLSPARQVAGVVVARRFRDTGRFNLWRDLFPQHWYVVVDDGISTRLRGLAIPHALFEALERGDSVEVTMSPYLRHVHHVTLVHQAKRRRPRRA